MIACMIRARRTIDFGRLVWLVALLASVMGGCSGPSSEDGGSDDECETCTRKACAESVGEYSPRRAQLPSARRIAFPSGGYDLAETCEENSGIAFACMRGEQLINRGFAFCGEFGYSRIFFPEQDPEEDLAFSYDSEGRLVRFERRFDGRLAEQRLFSWEGDAIVMSSTATFSDVCPIYSDTSTYNVAGDETIRLLDASCPSNIVRSVLFVWGADGRLDRTDIDFNGDGDIDNVHVYFYDEEGAVFVQWQDADGRPRSDVLRLGDCCNPEVCSADEPVIVGPSGT